MHHSNPERPVSVGETIRAGTERGFLVHVGGLVFPQQDRGRKILTYDNGNLSLRTEVASKSGITMVRVTGPANDRYSDRYSLVAVGITQVRDEQNMWLPDQIYFQVMGKTDRGPEAVLRLSPMILYRFPRSYELHLTHEPWELYQLEGEPVRNAILYAISNMGNQENWLRFLERNNVDGREISSDLVALIENEAKSVLDRKRSWVNPLAPTP